MTNRVIIFDTTLRDGEQSPGASMNLEEKITIARALKQLGVDAVMEALAEAGFNLEQIRMPLRQYANDKTE